MLTSFLPKASLLVGLSFVGFYSQQHLKVLGGTLPSRDLPSWRPEHKEAERRRFWNMVRWRICTSQKCFADDTMHKQLSVGLGKGGSA